MGSLRGRLLVASPQLKESTFARTVILLLQHSGQGALGVVLNRTINETVSGLWKQISGEGCESDNPVNMGGPVSGPLMALHAFAPLSELEVMGGVYVASSKDHLQKLVQQTIAPFRIFVGHAGWASGQLEQELEAGVWRVSSASVEHVFGECDDLWQRLMREIGDTFLRDVLEVSRVPTDASVN